MPPTDVPPTDAELLDLALQVGTKCRAGGRTLATAESCTGGLVAHLITEVPGSSTYFLGGVVTYADGVKTSLADVPAPVLEAHGA
ncbi:MAG TPA: CinA family protein, partial [Methylomirabilota bacterium]|nr:CinA family protein [Methylomirabilota bacterium]